MATLWLVSSLYATTHNTKVILIIVITFDFAEVSVSEVLREAVVSNFDLEAHLFY